MGRKIRRGANCQFLAKNQFKYNLLLPGVLGGVPPRAMPRVITATWSSFVDMLINLWYFYFCCLKKEPFETLWARHTAQSGSSQDHRLQLFRSLSHSRVAWVWGWGCIDVMLLHSVPDWMYHKEHLFQSACSIQRKPSI